MVLIEDIEFRVMQVHITKTFTAALHLSKNIGVIMRRGSCLKILLKRQY